MDERSGTEFLESRHLLTMKFRMADKLLKRHVEKRAFGTGLYRSQHRLLMHLFFTPDCSQAQLAGQLDISPAAVAVSLKKLEKGGYIRRRNQAEDNRRNLLEITDKGKQVVDVSIELFHGLDRILYGGFSEEEIAQFGTYFDRMCQNLLRYEGEGGAGAACADAREPEGAK